MDDDSYDNDQESLRGSHHRKAAVSWKKPLQSYKVSASGVFVHFYQRRESMLNQVPEQKKIYFLFVGEMETSSLSVKWSCLWRMGEGESRLNQESVRIHCFIHVPTSAILFLKKQQPNTKARLISLWRLNQYLLHRAALMKSDSMIILSIFLSIPPPCQGRSAATTHMIKGSGGGTYTCRRTLTWKTRAYGLHCQNRRGADRAALGVFICAVPARESTAVKE